MIYRIGTIALTALVASPPLAGASPKPAHPLPHAVPAPIEPAACKALQRSFNQNERAMAIIHDLNYAVYKAQQTFNETLRAQGAAADARALSEQSRLRAVLDAEDNKSLSEGDRITTLLIANHCRPPDHVTSWFTYSKTNPNPPNDATQPKSDTKINVSAHDPS